MRWTRPDSRTTFNSLLSFPAEKQPFAHQTHSSRLTLDQLFTFYLHNICVFRWLPFPYSRRSLDLKVDQSLLDSVKKRRVQRPSITEEKKGLRIKNEGTTLLLVCSWVTPFSWVWPWLNRLSSDRKAIKDTLRLSPLLCPFNVVSPSWLLNDLEPVCRSFTFSFFFILSLYLSWLDVSFDELSLSLYFRRCCFFRSLYTYFLQNKIMILVIILNHWHHNANEEHELLWHGNQGALKSWLQ